MNKYKKFIKRLGEGESGMVQVSSQHVKEMFPELFETKLEVGKWYNSIGDNGIALVFLTSKEYGYGVGYAGNWSDTVYVYPNATPAADKEVKEMLIKKAKKKLSNNLVQCLQRSTDNGVLNYHTVDFRFKENKLWIDNKSGLSILVFDNGKWATIIEEPKVLELTIEELEKHYGGKVKIVK